MRTFDYLEEVDFDREVLEIKYTERTERGRGKDIAPRTGIGQR